jgi:pilus assembly protein CpaB
MTTTLTKAPTFGGRKVLLGALMLGAVAAGLSVAFLASRQETTNPEAAADVVLQEVVVATREIPVGTLLDDSMVRVKLIPQSAVISDPFDQTSDVIGTVTRYPLQANEQLAVGRLVDETKGSSISFKIPDGLRGFTVAVSQTESPAGLMVPGDYVDIIVAASVKHIIPASGVPVPLTADTEFKAAVTLLQNVQVISVERNYINDGVVYDSTTRGNQVDSKDDVDNVTLAVTPEQAQLLVLARQEGKLTLVLRPFGENEQKTLAPVAEPIRIN